MIFADFVALLFFRFRNFAVFAILRYFAFAVCAATFHQNFEHCLPYAFCIFSSARARFIYSASDRASPRTSGLNPHATIRSVASCLLI